MHGSNDHGPAVHDHHLAGHVGARLGREKDSGAGNIFRIADATHGRTFFYACRHFGVLPQGPGEICLNQAWCDTVHPNIVRAELECVIAGQLEVGSLGNIVCANRT